MEVVVVGQGERPQPQHLGYGQENSLPPSRMDAWVSLQIVSGTGPVRRLS